MINTTGIVKFLNSELLCYDSPKIEIVGQNSNKTNITLLNVDLVLRSQSEGTMANQSITIDTSILKTVSDDNNIGASYMVDNLYIMLESLLVQTLQLSNPDTVFKIETI
jgi:hypothetical protein